MAKYILNQNQQDSPSGNNFEVHNENTCDHLPYMDNRLPIGYYDNCSDALMSAKIKYPGYAARVDGCYWCCRSCHKE